MTKPTITFAKYEGALAIIDRGRIVNVISRDSIPDMLLVGASVLQDEIDKSPRIVYDAAKVYE